MKRRAVSCMARNSCGSSHAPLLSMALTRALPDVCGSTIVGPGAGVQSVKGLGARFSSAQSMPKLMGGGTAMQFQALLAALVSAFVNLSPFAALAAEPFPNRTVKFV